MSDYISLEELRAMDDAKLYERWREAQFPFDNAVCGNCVTQHKYFRDMCGHESFKQGAAYLSVKCGAAKNELRQDLAEIYALRMFHRDLYPSTPEPPVHGEPVQGEPTKSAALETAEIMSDQKLFKQIVGVAATLEEDTRLGRLHSFEEAFGEE